MVMGAVPTGDSKAKVMCYRISLAALLAVQSTMGYLCSRSSCSN